MFSQHPFRQKLQTDYDRFLQEQGQRFPAEEILRIDLHCHDYNSDVPDELWGRILRLPETWLKSAELLSCLKNHGADVFTVTNHNNGRSCWELMEKGHDVLPGSEFTCHFPEFDVSVHVLTYGFTPVQEAVLCEKRQNIYDFLDYCREWDLPTVLPHPLYFYSPSFRPPPSLFEKFALMFERFEVLNGQRDLWQNMMTARWVQSITPEKLDYWGRKHGIAPDRFCQDPYRKRMTGGSDCHMGLFAGTCGTALHVPNLAERLKRGDKRSEIALDVLRHGGMAPFGHLGEEEKLNVAFLDYFCQVALNMEDPGLVRMFLHRGSLRDKMMCLAIGNAMQELQRHNYTMRFLKIFHDALGGKRPGLLTTWRAAKPYRALVQQLDRLARSHKQGPAAYIAAIQEVIPQLYQHLNGILAERVKDRLQPQLDEMTRGKAAGELVRGMELPSHLRMLFNGEDSRSKGRDMSHVNIGKALDNLSFPALATTLIAGSNFASSKVLYNNRGFLNDFAQELGEYEHPKRVLWLTDTFADKNGVSTVLQSTRREVMAQGLDMDFLVCHETLDSDDHLKVVRPVGTFSIPGFDEQVFRIPDLLQVQRLFREGGYDRIMCSTEFPMGLIALFLRKAFSVPAHFYMHTDWLDYFEKNTSLEHRALDRVRRMIRALYRQFDGIFVLNSEHRQWLQSKAMGIAAERIHQTAHWADGDFKPCPESKASLFGVDNTRPVFLYVGRLSEEKGVFELPTIMARIQQKHPEACLVLAGTGPAQDRLRRMMPEAVFLGWVKAARLSTIYATADMLLLPSRFDTFGCVVLEAMSCGTPVAAYDTKGPRDIIKDRESGFLCENAAHMAERISQLLDNPNMLALMRREAYMRSKAYNAQDIMAQLIKDVGLVDDHRGESNLIPIPLPMEEQVGDEEEGFLAEIMAMVE